MSTTTLTTIIKMIESLPEDKQEKVVEHLRYYITELEDEMKWDKLFKDTEKDLSNIAKEVKHKVAMGEVEDFDFNRL